MKKITSFGERLIAARLRANLTQLELAILCGWSKTTDYGQTGQGRVSHYERGIREPKNRDIMKLCEALEIDPRWLQFGD